MRTSSSLAKLSLFVPLFFLSGCGSHPEAPVHEGRIRLRCDILPVGALAKSGKIELRELQILFHRGDDTLLRESIAVTSLTRSIAPIYSLPSGAWMVCARILDATGHLIYSDSGSFLLMAGDTMVDSRITLYPRYSELSVRIYPVDTARVQGIQVRLRSPRVPPETLSVHAWSGLGRDSSVTLSYDYVPTRDSLAMEVEVVGTLPGMRWTWSGSLYVVPSRDTALHVLLKYEGPALRTGITILPVAVIGIIAQIPAPDSRPSLTLTAASGSIRGTIRNLENVESYRVALIRRSAGGWYSHPTYAVPSAVPSAEGTFSTAYADTLKAYLVPAGFAIPPVSGPIPSSLESAALASAIFPSP